MTVLDVAGWLCMGALSVAALGTLVAVGTWWWLDREDGGEP